MWKDDASNVMSRFPSDGFVQTAELHFSTMTKARPIRSRDLIIKKRVFFFLTS